jgi:hypothetical protein
MAPENWKFSNKTNGEKCLRNCSKLDMEVANASTD